MNAGAGKDDPEMKTQALEAAASVETWSWSNVCLCTGAIRVERFAIPMNAAQF